MITVLTVGDADKLGALYSANGQAVNDFSQAVSAVDTNTDEVLGVCLFEITTDKITIGKIVPEADIMLADGLLRSALHVAISRGITAAFFGDSANFDLLKRLNFIGDETEKSLKFEKLTECGCGQ